MKILHVVPSLSAKSGGVAVSVRELCRGLAERGVEVELMTTLRGHDPAVDGPSDDLLKRAGVSLRYFQVHRWGWLGQDYAYSGDLGAALRSAVPKSDLVHIHAVWLYPTAAAASACRNSGVPYVMSPCGALDPYGMRVHRLAKQLYGALIESKNLRGAAAIHFTSALEQRDAELFGAACPGAVIPRSIRAEGIPAPDPGSFRKIHPEIGRRKVLLFLGRLHAKKRLDIVAEAFVGVCRRRDDAHLVVAGPDEGGGTQVREIVGKAGFLDRVTFTGLLDKSDKWAALQDSSLFLLPSEDENFGVAALEAMAAGVPVLLSSRVGLADDVAAGKAGTVLERDPAAWTSAIERLLDDTAARAAAAANGRKLVDSKFSSTQVAAAMQAFYSGILNGR